MRPNDLFDLSGRVVVITGGAGLLGQRHAEAVVGAGGIPVLADLRSDRLDPGREGFAARFGPQASVVGVDITDPRSVESLLQTILDTYGRVDVLINNAANNPKMEPGSDVEFSRLESFPLEQWQADLAVGLTGSFLCSRVIGGEMAKRGRGVIVNVASDLALIGPDQRLYRMDGLAEDLQPVKPVTYSVVKSGLIGLTRYLATYWATAGVRVNAISPGGVYTDQPDEFVQRLSTLIPMGRMANVDEYAGAILFLCSDASSYMTGANLVVDGGRTAWCRPGLSVGVALVGDAGPTPSARGLAGTSDALAALLDRDPGAWRSALDRRYGVLDEVLDGRRSAIVYPAARLGRDVVPQLNALGVRVLAYGDRDPSVHGGEINGLPVLSPAQVAARHQADVILVASTMYDSMIREDLESRGCEHVIPIGYLNVRLPDIFRTREYDGAWKAAIDPANRPAIEAAHALLGDQESRTVFEGKLGYYLGRDKANIDGIRSSNTIYFDRSVHDLNPDEVVVDGGAYVGDTLSSFVDESAGRFRGYYAFEPDPVSFDRLALEAARDPARVIAVQAGLARATASARLLSSHGADARLLHGDEAGGDEVPVVSLDEYFEERRPPTLIKMDIEGAEADALLGAAGIIAASQPKLAISAYHLPTDLWRIPLLLEKLMPGSRLFLRHYTREVDDTVCYALPAHA